MSFFDFDACGDGEAGRVLRKLILEMVKACPYSAAAREAFRSNVARNTEDMLSRIFQARADGSLDQLKGPPELEEEKVNPNGGPKSCKEYRETPRYIERRNLLMRYAHKEIGADEALGGSDCPSGPAAL
ncbi:MAG TPA: hypothetical protein VMW18_19930 [Candidatus Binatia bacterium]|nr:hypothetical protein [Candidatus Binatia bacterium]